MPRHPRWFQADLPLHIVQRGNDRTACFRTVEDRQAYLHWFGEISSRLHVRLHAYVLMTNHVHLLLTPANRDDASNLMQSLGRRYVRYFNEKHGRTGTLWEGRFKAHPVQCDSHLMSVHRYIELNPVRAGIVSRPDEYRWSSHRRNAHGRPDHLITEHALYTTMGATDIQRQSAYRSMFGAPDDEMLRAIRAAVSSGRPLGDQEFCQELSARLSLPLAGRNGRPRKSDGAAESCQYALDGVETRL